MAGIVHPRRDLVDQEPAVAEHEHLDRQHADIAELVARSSRRCGGPPARRLRQSAPGTRETLRMWSRCSFSVTSKHSTVPSWARAATTDTSRANGTKASRMQGWPPTSRQAASGIGAVFDRHLALAVIAEPPRLEHRGPADPLDRRGTTPPAVATAAKARCQCRDR